MKYHLRLTTFGMAGSIWVPSPPANPIHSYILTDQLHTGALTLIVRCHEHCVGLYTHCRVKHPVVVRAVVTGLPVHRIPGHNAHTTSTGMR